MLTNIGLAIIILAWLYQLVKVSIAGNSIRLLFLCMYTVGVGLLVFDGFNTFADITTLLNLLSLAVVVGLVIVLIWKKNNLLVTKKEGDGDSYKL